MSFLETPRFPELQRRRIEKIRERAVEASIASLRDQIGDRAEAALNAPQARAVLERHVAMLVDLMGAVWAFSGTAVSAEALSAAALAYRDAQLALEAAVECIIRDATGLTEH